MVERSNPSASTTAGSAVAVKVIDEQQSVVEYTRIISVQDSSSKKIGQYIYVLNSFLKNYNSLRRLVVVPRATRPT